MSASQLSLQQSLFLLHVWFIGRPPSLRQVGAATGAGACVDFNGSPVGLRCSHE